ncbi:hypothetical protein RUND412_003657 [Rhizina undulata]
MSASDSSKPLYEFFVHLPDLPNANRHRARPLHLQKAIPMIRNNDFLRFGGAYLKSHPETAEEDPVDRMAGSFTVVVAESKEDVIKRLKEDPYTTEGVWDIEKARIWPFKTAVSVPFNYDVKKE